MTTSNLNFVINEAGNEFYENKKKDSRLSFFVAGPAFLIFVGGCFFMTAGFTLKFLLIMIWPLIMIGLAFFYTPLIGRGKYTSHTIKRITIDRENISLETYDWFSYDAITISARLTDVTAKVWNYQMYYKGKKVFMIILNNSEANTFYLVEEFFDNIDDILKLFNNN